VKVGAVIVGAATENPLETSSFSKYSLEAFDSEVTVKPIEVNLYLGFVT